MPSQTLSKLREAQQLASELFKAIETTKLIQADKTELDINQAIYDLAKKDFGTHRFWHKRIVRAGENTLSPYRENPPNRTLAEDDIVFLDFGPIFEDWEADFGRTYVLGNDPQKLKLKNDIEAAFQQGQSHYLTNPNITASEFYHWLCGLAKDYGWEYGGPHAGHLVGKFPHEKILGDDIPCYIHPDNHLPMSASDPKGQPRHWILEIHFVDKAQKIGGFYEELLVPLS